MAVAAPSRVDLLVAIDRLAGAVMASPRRVHALHQAARRLAAELTPAPFLCPQCGVGFGSERRLVEHGRLVHGVSSGVQRDEPWTL